MYNGKDADVGKKGEVQESEKSRVLVILNEHLEHEHDGCDCDEERQEGDSDHQLEGRDHGAQVGADIKGVCAGDKQCGRVQDRSREILLNEGSKTLSSGEPETTGEFFDRRGQWDRYRDRPQHPQAELSAELRISADSRR